MLVPNNKQKTKLFQFANTARFAYNWALSREQESKKSGGKFISDYDLRKEFTQLKRTEEYLWLNTVSNNVTKQAIKDACETYKRFFKGYSRFPKFKSRKKSIPTPSLVGRIEDSSYSIPTVRYQFNPSYLIRGFVYLQFVGILLYSANLIKFSFCLFFFLEVANPSTFT